MKNFDKKLNIESGEEVNTKELIKNALSSTPNILVIGEIRGEKLHEFFNLIKESNLIYNTSNTHLERS